MNPNFKLRFTEMLNNDPSQSHTENESTGREASYPTASNVRNVNFVMLNGKMDFFHYGYLHSGEYCPNGYYIVLHFGANDVKLTGICLIPLYFDFMLHIPQNVICVDARYNVTADPNKPIVNTITIEKAKT